MKLLQNLHTHTTYCDGKDTPEQMIMAAIEKGFLSIGFSGHSYVDFDEIASMSMEETEQYKKEVRALAQKYKDKIKVYCGIEYDFYSNFDISDFDYTIGSVHALKIGDRYFGIDHSMNKTIELVKNHFGGNGYAFAKAYYETLAELPSRGKFDIIGHFDLVTKYRDKVAFFNGESKQYRDLALGAVSALKGKIPLFEVNSGAIGRGYRTTPYPDEFLVKELKKQGFGAVITSDCHNSSWLDIGYKNALELLEECGYKEIYYLTDEGFKAESIKEQKR